MMNVMEYCGDHNQTYSVELQEDSFGLISPEPGIIEANSINNGSFETVPLTSINDNKPTQLNEQIHEIEDEGIPLVESNEGHGYTQLEWDLFWGFSVDYEFKYKELFHRMKYNIDTFKLNYIVLFTILFSISLFVNLLY
ncbi:hypothetical protein KM1_325480 [Entamoeba histolytica HM-3:IMSS]|uniref:Uncharacterized protein n=1 Tax=Entamoeba histolytica HM-3:IMSS TaxID=885315 RepID=M7W6I3_ENTHI|nr:hypothetical protein KM1_325480 [Entamoeba histolytica HM-3:IMSS]